MSPPFPAVSGRECIRALSKAGFQEIRQTGSHIIVRRNDPFTQLTVPNHRELAAGTLRAIIREAGLSVADFLELLRR